MSSLVSGILLQNPDGDNIQIDYLTSVWESCVRLDMHTFINEEVDLTAFANPALVDGDLDWCKAEMKRIACDMDLNMNVVGWSMQGGSMVYLSFTDEMHSALCCRLIEATKCHFATVQRERLKERRIHSWLYQRAASRRGALFTRAANWKEMHACARDKFLTRVGLEPPQLLRVIDVEATCRQGERVVLIDYLADATLQQVGYSAISHTYGMDVYKVFDCPCASECSANIRQRCSDKACPHDDQDDASSPQHKKVVKDILRMCDILRKAGVRYAWHDGVCIAQHDDAEVEDAIKHMGWIYASATETIVFLHYVGSPMAPIRNSSRMNELYCRWQSRVWTLQEGALSKCRRYCVRAGAPVSDCQSLEELEERIAVWYGDDSSKIQIMEEERFLDFVEEIHTVLGPLCVDLAKKVLLIPDDADDDIILEINWMWTKAVRWREVTRQLLATLYMTCFTFPTIGAALFMCSDRQSKHRGDTINSILALAEVKDFVAPKDVNVEGSTIEFFKRQGQLGLARAVFSINQDPQDKKYITEERKHTWPPILWERLVTATLNEDTIGMGWFKVLEDDHMMEWRADLICVQVRFTVRKQRTFVETDEDPGLPNDFSICLDMDLTPFDVKNKFKASISERITGDAYISAIEPACSSQTLVFPSEIEEGDQFHSYLVSANLMAIMLIVQGSLDARAVSKVGTFTPTLHFWEMLGRLHPALQKLIII